MKKHGVVRGRVWERQEGGEEFPESRSSYQGTAHWQGHNRRALRGHVHLQIGKQVLGASTQLLGS